jgi:hypothetical protein
MSALFMLFMFSNSYAAVDLLKPGQTYQLPGTLENTYDKAVNQYNPLHQHHFFFNPRA